MNKLFFFLLIPALCFSLTEEEWVQRVQSYSVLKDPKTALEEAHEGIKAYPGSQKLFEVVIRLYGKLGEEEEMMKTFRLFQTQFPKEEMPRDLIEDISWAVIEKGAGSSSTLTRAYAMIAAALGNDSRGVSILAKNIHDSNRLIRLLAVDFASHFRDRKLQNLVYERFLQERDPIVRLEVISAIGTMKIEKGESKLLEILSNPLSTAEEKQAAIESIVKLKENVEKKEIESLAKSPRAGLRILAAELIYFNNKSDEVDLLLPLLQDPNNEVKKAALLVLGLLRAPLYETHKEQVNRLLSDRSSEVAMTAAWVLLLEQPKEGQEHLKKWLFQTEEKERYYAMVLLASSGKYGFPLTLQVFKETNDPYVKINLAKTLIQQRVREDLGAKALYEAIRDQKERWMVKKIGHFEVIVKNEGSYRTEIPNYPEALNQIARLEIFNELAMLNYPGTFEIIREYLHDRVWGVTGAAASLLLTEGEEETLEMIRPLLQDPSEKVKLQAALVLAAWGSDAEALTTLQTMYSRVSRSQREQIIEAVGKIGDISAIPFLLDRLEEPHQKERMIAAASLLKILYH